MHGDDDHNFVEIENTQKDATCTEDGKEADKKCSICGEVIYGAVIKASGHKWDDGVITKEPTETEDGIKTYTCTECKETKTEKIDKKTDENKNNQEYHCASIRYYPAFCVCKRIY